LLQIYTFAVATSHSRLFRLTISVQDGRRVAQVAPFLHSKGLLGRLFGSSSTYGLSSEPILSLALGEAPGVKLLYALSPSSIQRWHLVEGGVDVLAVEQDVRSLIVTAVQQAHSSASADNGSGSTSSAISLIDCAVTVGGALAVLYVERSGSGAASSSAIAVLNFNATSSSLSVTSIRIGLASRISASAGYSEWWISGLRDSTLIADSQTSDIRLRVPRCAQESEQIQNLRRGVRNRRGRREHPFRRYRTHHDFDTATSCACVRDCGRGARC